MKFTGQFTGVTLDVHAYAATLQKKLKEALYEGARAWLNAASGRVPVWSGMARSSLYELSQLVDGKLVVKPRARGLGKKKPGQKKARGRKIKGRVRAGRALGSVKEHITTSLFIIEITTAVPHYTSQEYRQASSGGSPSAPWFSQIAGLGAFKNATAGKVKLPKIPFKPVVRILK